MPIDTDHSRPSNRNFAVVVRFVILALLGALLLVALVWFGDERILRMLAGREAQLRTLYEHHPVATLAVAFFIYVIVTGISLPGAGAMSVLYGWLFGFWPALLLVSFASTSGATIAFLLSRYFFGLAIQAQYGQRLATFNAAMEREGAFYLFTLRLIPQAPFFVINAVMGLTKLRTVTFWWVSQFGMLPGTCIYVLAGANAPTLKKVAAEGLSSILNWPLIAALILLGVLPLALKWLLQRVRRSSASDAGEAGN